MVRSDCVRRGSYLAAGLLLTAGLLLSSAPSRALAEEPAAATQPSASPAAAADQPQEKEKAVPAALNFQMKSLDGKDVNLAQYQGQVVLMVNVASKCGHTPQYKDLQALHGKYAEKGLAILGFPANDFGKQEPGSDSDIAAFCEKNYGVQFPMFSKVAVTGADKCPLYQHLTGKESNPACPGEVKWNFEKFLIGRDGQIAGRFASKVKPLSEELVAAIEAELAK